MSKGLEALERLMKNYYEMCVIDNCNDDMYQKFNNSSERGIIEKELKDFEWLKSKISIEWFDKLSTDDKLKLMEIMGVKYEQ